MAVLQQLSDAIRDSGLTANELEKRSGVSRSVISRLLRGERSVSVATLEKLAGVLGVEVVLRKQKGA